MQFISNLAEVSGSFDVAVLDQWGVMHNGTTAYEGAADALRELHSLGKQIVVVSNSGKRAQLNLQRINRIGLPTECIRQVVTSGETLWEDFDAGEAIIDGRKICRVFPITGKQGDAEQWAQGSNAIKMDHELTSQVDAILLMGLPDDATDAAYAPLLRLGLELGKPMICSNPDKKSPRPGGLVLSPGALADRYEQMGGTVVWYGKPHANIYRAVMRRYPKVKPERFLMVGDSLEHDIAGARNVGIRSALVCLGIHADDFGGLETGSEILEAITEFTKLSNCQTPDYAMRLLR